MYLVKCKYNLNQLYNGYPIADPFAQIVLKQAQICAEGCEGKLLYSMPAC